MEDANFFDEQRVLFLAPLDEDERDEEDKSPPRCPPPPPRWFWVRARGIVRCERSTFVDDILFYRAYSVVFLCVLIDVFASFFSLSLKN